MEVMIVKDGRAVGNLAARFVIEAVRRKPNLVLGLASGRTVVPFYRSLAGAYKSGRISFSKVVTFNLDDYIGLDENDKESLKRFLKKSFVNKVNLRKGNSHFLSDSGDAVKICRVYEKEIKRAGGIDLQILGLGKNGHIGFNEPGSGLRSRTRKVRLQKETVKDKFSEAGKPLKDALTMGVGTILDAKKIILLASGREKADVVARVVGGKVSARVPASFLQKHKDAVFILDKEAASGL